MAIVRWDKAARGRTNKTDKVDAFLAEVIAVSRKHGMSISHEDSNGAFIVEPFSEHNAEWLNMACISSAKDTYIPGRK
jgi:hypothetical protein